MDDNEEDNKSNNNKTEEVRVPAIVSYEISDEEEIDIIASCSFLLSVKIKFITKIRYVTEKNY